MRLPLLHCHVSLPQRNARVAPGAEQGALGWRALSASSGPEEKAAIERGLLGSSCLSSGSSSSYNQCFMTNANKSQLWNSSHAMSKPVQNRITTRFDFFPLSLNAFHMSRGVGTARIACVHSESGFESPDWKESKSVGKQTQSKHWGSGAGGVFVFPARLTPWNGLEAGNQLAGPCSGGRGPGAAPAAL